MSILNVNRIQPVGSGQTVTINAANISAGSATVTAGTFSGNLSGNVNSTGVTTVTTLNATSIVGVTTAGITTAYIGSVNDGPISGARNRIINGDMRLDQRNVGASLTLNATSQYPVDRFPSYKGTSSATVTAQRSTTAPSGFTNSIIFTASTGATPAIGDINAFWQSIEGFNVADLGWGTSSAQSITMSFWVRSSVIGTYSFSLNNNASNRFYVATYVVNAANTWEYKTVTIAGDTSGTWLTDNSTGIQITWDLGYGTNFNGTAGSWGSSTIRRTSGSVQWIATTGATFYITGVQLESGTVATPFERRSYGQELALCQRYYAKSYKQSVVPGSNDGDGCSVFYSHTSGSYTINGNIIFPVEMRSEPAVSIWSNTGTSGQLTASDSIAKSGTPGAISQRQCSMNVTSGNNNVTYRCQWVSSIEL